MSYAVASTLLPGIYPSRVVALGKCINVLLYFLCKCHISEAVAGTIAMIFSCLAACNVFLTEVKVPDLKSYSHLMDNFTLNESENFKPFSL